tara:strand:- start:638 stop:1060 length:423 start_codon:yes stop_codon:yes gene_type:complete
MESAQERYWIILFRRAMVKIASRIATKNMYKVLVSGENIGQVASQTLSNIVAIQDATNIPIIRPLAGMNKEEIVNLSENIGTYNLSIEPYEDCCSYFVPSNPETKSKLDIIQKIEREIQIEPLICKEIEKINIKEFVCYE